MSEVAQLKKIILIDSINKGNLIELRVDQNTALMGSNGIGKTTFLKLLAIFYGTPPGLAVRADGNNLSFADWFLPRQSSYLVFEYLNHCLESCCMILHQSGDAYAYRLVSGAWESSLLYEDESNGVIVSPGEVINHLRERNRRCTPELTGAAYRSIIQFNTNSSNLEGLADARQRELVQVNRSLFSLAPARKSVAGIDTVILTLIESRASYSGLRKVVRDILEQENIDPEQTLQGVNINEFTAILNQHESIRLFDDILLARIEELGEQEGNYLSVVEQLGKAKYRLGKMVEAYEKNKTKEIEQFALLDEKKAEQLEQQDKKEEQFLEQRSQTSLALDKLNRRHDEVHAKNKHYEQLNVAQMVQRSNQRTTWQQQQKSLFSERSILIEGERAITSEFERLLAQSAAEHTTFLEQQRNEQHTHRVAFERWRNQYNISSHTQRIEYEQQRDEQLESYRDQYQRAELATTSLLVERRQLDGQNELANDQAGLREALNHINELREERERRQANTQQLKSAQRQLEQRRNDAVQGVESIFVQMASKQHQRDQLIAQLNASRSTLLGFLREHHPNWQETIGRLVSPDILMRDDLNPERISQEVESLYGVIVDTSLLPLPALADTESLRQSISEIEAAIKQLKQDKAEQEKVAQTLEKELKTSANTIVQAEMAERDSMHQIEGAVRHYDALKSDAKERFNQYVENLNSDIEKNKNQTQQLKVRWESAVATWKDRLAQLHKTQQTQYNEAQLQRDNALDAVERLMTQAVSQHHERISQINQSKREALSEKGIDPNRLIQIESKLEEIAEQIRKIDMERDTVEAYQRWLESDWSGVTQLSIERDQAAVSHKELERKYSDWRQTVSTEKQALQSQRKSLKNKINELQENIEKAGRLLNGYGLERLVERSDTSYFYASQDPNDVQDQLISLSQQRSQINKKAESLYREIRDYYGRRRLADSAYYAEIHRIDATAQQEQTSFNDETWLAAVEPLRTTLIDAHQNQKQMFMLRLETVGRQTCDRKGALNDLHRSIGRLGLKVTERSRAIAEPFEALEVEDVKIKSRIHDLSFWSDLNRFEKEFERWQATSGEGAIPNMMPASGLIGAINELRNKLEANPISAKLAESFDFEITFYDQGKRKVINSDASFESASSNGLNTIVLCLIFVVLFEMLRNDAPLKMVFPLDEALKLSPENHNALSQTLQERDIVSVAAFPAGSAEVLSRFSYAYQLNGRAHEEMTVSEYENPTMDDLDALENILEVAHHE